MPQFRQQLESFDCVLANGIGMSLAIRWLNRILAARASFEMTSLAAAILTLAAQERRRVVLIGGVPGCAERAGTKLRDVFPGLDIVGVFDGYGEQEERAREIAALAPAIAVCGMGAGAQEAVLLALARTGWRGCGFTCRRFLDQLSERSFHYPARVDRLQLRFAYRLGREPRRLWRRYLLNYPPFLAALAAAAAMTLLRGPRRTDPHAPRPAPIGGFIQPAVEEAADLGAG